MPHSHLSQNLLASKVLALAIYEMFPGAQLAGGEVSDLGFSYSFTLPQSIDAEALPLIEEKMRFLIKQAIPIKKMDMMRQNAESFLLHHRQPLLAALALSERDNVIGLVNIGPLYDLCKGEVTDETSGAGAVKLLKILKSPILLPNGDSVSGFRIDGAALPDQKELKSFLKMMHAAEAKDHRVVGNEMQLFTPIEGDDSPFWLPKGTLLWDRLLDFWWKGMQSLNFQKVVSPLSIQEASHAYLYKVMSQGTVELPIRFAEWIVKNEKVKKTKNLGLLSARSYLAEEATLFCLEGQVQDELISSLQFIIKTIKIFGFELHWSLIAKSIKKEGALNWDKSLDDLKKALNAVSISFTLDKEGRSRFGPKVEGRIKDAYGREWSGPSLMIDCFHPAKLDLVYQETKQRPVMIRRSVFGSKERFIALLVEHYAGQWPLWLAPEQVRVISVGGKCADYAEKIKAQIEQKGFRVGLDGHKSHLGGKVHAAEREKVPYVVIVGEAEKQNDRITLRHRGRESRIELAALLDELEAAQTEEKVVLT